MSPTTSQQPSQQQQKPTDDLDILLPTDSVDADAEQLGVEPNDLESEALAFVSRINDKLRKSTDTLTPLGVPRVA